MAELVLANQIRAESGSIGHLQLNRSQALNSLNLEMVETISRCLVDWARDDEIALVFIDSASERAFCAGGDVKSLVQAGLSGGQGSMASDFFFHEYQMDHLLHHYPKPIVVWGDSLVLGGGLGVFMGASHRIVTERSQLAMPEISIGFFTDVGATHFLNRLPSGLGLFLSWTAARVHARDAIDLGLATQAFGSDQKNVLMAALQGCSWKQNNTVNIRALNDLFKSFRKNTSVLPDPLLVPLQATLQEIFVSSDPHSVRDQFLRLKTNDVHAETYLEQAKQTFLSGSPSSAHLQFHLLNRAKGQSLLEAFASEWSLAKHLYDERGDFFEGVRARLIDKDQNPQWKPKEFSAVDPEAIQRKLQPHPDENKVRSAFFEFARRANPGLQPE